MTKKKNLKLTKWIAVSLSMAMLAGSAAAAAADDPSADLTDDPGLARVDAADDAAVSGPDDLYVGSLPDSAENTDSSAADSVVEGVNPSPAFTFQGSGTDTAVMQAICDYLTRTINTRYEVNSRVVATVPVVNVVSSHVSGSSRYVRGGFSVWNFTSDGKGRLVYLSGGTDIGLLVLRPDENGSYQVDENASSLTGDSTPDSGQTSSGSASDGSTASDKTSDSSASSAVSSPEAGASPAESGSPATGTASGSASAVPSSSPDGGQETASSGTVSSSAYSSAVNDSTISSALSFDAYEKENQTARLVAVFTDDADRTQYLTSAFIRMYLKENGLSYSSYSLSDQSVAYSLAETDPITPEPTPSASSGSAQSEGTSSVNPDSASETASSDAESVESSRIVPADPPEMNIVGDWISSSGNVRMQIAAENEDSPLMIIDQQDSASQNTEWILHGTYLDGVISYTFGTKVTQTFDENGNETDTVQYTDGTGIFSVSADSNTISWEDDKGDTGNGLVFSQAF